MAETVNIGEIATKLSAEIFESFLWKAHPKHEENFPCINPEHLTDGPKPKQKASHPGDVVFFYQDPYLGKRVYLHTDLKSYGKDSIGTVKLRAALQSLSMTIECARHSTEYRTLYSIPDDIDHEIRGLLFVHNHDGKFKASFDEVVGKTDLSTLHIAPHVYLHFLGPRDIDRLYSIANDLIRLKGQKTLPDQYSFYYPDLVMWRRHGDVWDQPATIEALTAPYFIVKYPSAEKSSSGYLIYYNRQGASVPEFEYFLDSLSRYQMLEPDELIRIRIVHQDPDINYKSNFLAAINKYAKAWGFEPKRTQILEDIKIEPITAVVTSYSAGDIGWRSKL
ncbi:MAG: hypothetical protein WBK51_17220 [Polaromonas sp.]